MRSRWTALAAIVVLLAACDGAQTVSPPDQRAYEVSLATSGERVAVSWHGGSGGHDAIWLESLDARGRAAAAPVRVTDGLRDAYEPDLQWLDGDFVVAWYEKGANGSLLAWLGRFGTDGRERWRTALAADDRNSRNPVVRVGSGKVFVAWLEAPTGRDPEVRFAAFDGAGGLIASPTTLGPASGETWNLNAALDGEGAFHVVYDAAVGSRAKEIRLARRSPSGEILLWRLGEDDGFDSTYPDLSIDGDRAALTWFDARDGNPEVYLAVGTVGELTTDLATRARRVTDTPGASIGAYLAWNGARLAVAWCDEVDGQAEIFRQEFDRDGHPSAAIVRMTKTATDSLIPSIRPFGKGFFVAWTERRALPAGAEQPHGATATSRVQVQQVQ